MSTEVVPEQASVSSVAQVSSSEAAADSFLERVRGIAEVAGARRVEGGDSGRVTIAVYVPTLRSQAARDVFDLEGAVLNAHPGARFKVRVLGMQERGLTPADIAANP